MQNKSVEPERLFRKKRLEPEMAEEMNLRDENQTRNNIAAGTHALLDAGAL